MEQSEFRTALDDLIGRLESWSYADTDAGSGVPVEIARELASLARQAPTPEMRTQLARAQDALDDGLSAERVAAELYRIQHELGLGPA
jgi:hypothetical protein